MNNEIENEQPTMNNAQNNPEGGISLNPNNNEQIGIEIDTASQNIQNAMSNNSTTISQPTINMASQNFNTNQNDSFKEPKSKKGLIIGIVAIVVVVALLAGGFFYLKSTFNAESFLTKSAKEITTWIDNAFENANISNNDLLANIDKYDLKGSMDLKLTSTSSELKNINNLGINIKEEMSIKDSYLDTAISLTQNSGKLDANMTLLNNKVYLDSKDIYNELLSTDMEENPFTTMKETLNQYKDLINPDNWKYAVNKLITYYAEAMNEAIVTTKINGLSATYTYEINDENKDKVINKFESLIKNDEKLNNIFKDLENNDTISTSFNVEPIKITVKVKLPNNKVENFTIESDEEVIKGENIEKDKYKITTANETMEIECNNKSIYLTISGTNENQDQLKLEITKAKTIFVLKSDQVNVDMTITPENKNTSNIDLKVNSEKVKINGNIKSTIDNKKEDLSGKVTVDYDTYNLGLEFKANTTYGENLVTKKSLSGGKEITNLTDEETSTIMTNFMSKASSFEIFNSLSGLLNSWSDIDDNLMEDTCKSMCPSGDVFSIDDESGTCYCTDGSEISI